MSHILPIEHWRLGDMLVDPTGAFYEPASPPAIISDDKIMSLALDFARENAHRIDVTLLCGLQTADEDLGTPGEFEGLMFQAHLYGSSKFGLSAKPGAEGYARRVETAIIEYGQHILPFNTAPYPNATTRDNFIALSAAVDRGAERLQAAQSKYIEGHDVGSEPPEEEGLDAFVGEAHLTNHLNWLTVANTCLQVAQLQRKGDVKVLIDEGITGHGIARTFGAIGVQAELHEIRLDTWPEGAVSEVLDFESVLTTGYVTY